MAVAVGCTKPNPAATCVNGTCSDPAFPFCDVDGAFGGTPNTCVAVTCATGSIGGCQGSDELVCNAAGDNYDTQPCPDGCTDPTGCNGAPVADGPPAACTASTVTCTADGSLQTCDGSGNVASTQPCALGCSDVGGSHCKQVIPSNNLQQFLDSTPNPSDLSLANGTLDIDARTFTPTGGSATAIRSFSVAAPSGGAPVTVFVARNLTLADITIDSMNSGFAGGPAAAFIATGTLTVQGRILVASGAVDIAGCTSPVTPENTVGSAIYAAGAGGGGHATAGADGGDVPGGATHLAHGAASGTDALVPLRGGCPAGGTAATTLAGRGGGALQLTSLTSIDIEGVIAADGLATNLNDGFGGTNFGGGGGGGGILLEAPQVTLGVAGKLLVRGGGGNSGDFQAVEAPDANTPIPGATSQVFDGTRTNGGAGGTDTTSPVAGTSTAHTVNGESTIRVAGGGGGGVGRIRINTADGTFGQAGSSVLAGRVTTSVVTAQ